MRPKWPKLASLAKKTCTLCFQFFNALLAIKGYVFKNIFHYSRKLHEEVNFLNINASVFF